MSKLPNSQAEEYVNNVKLELARRLRDTLYNEITFSGNYKSCCVGIVDAVNSTNIAAKLVNGELCRYYSIFLNAMAVIAREFGAVVVKNVGDSLLYYFPQTFDGHNKSALKNTLECSLAMIESHLLINEKMREENLPSINYRVSADYGNVMIAKPLNTSNDDIFGSTVNLCAKINSKAVPNSTVIGGDMHQIVKNFDGYDFNLMTSYSSGLKLEYPIYTVIRNKSRQ